MSSRSKKIWVVLALLAMVSFVMAWPMYKKLTFKAASAALVQRTQAVVEKNPRLKPDWDKAISEDGVLSWPKANAILEKVGEKADPE